MLRDLSTFPGWECSAVEITCSGALKWSRAERLQLMRRVLSTFPSREILNNGRKLLRGLKWSGEEI
jgi:hypothetical protein